MDSNPNFDLLMEKELLTISGTPRLLLHRCCGPCSSSVLERLSRYFDITVLYYNPNIYPPEEFEKRLGEQRRLIELMEFENAVSLAVEPYDHGEFALIAKDYENIPEGGERCVRCFRLRLERTARRAKDGGFEYFTTTLSVSPHKNARILNSLGSEIGERFGVKYLYSDFKKKNGFKRSTELSKRYDLYRQIYCGCEYSRGYPY